MPALSTRRTETEVELQDGQTFAIAGLMNNSMTSTMTKIPGIGDIPILGWLFTYSTRSRTKTNLMVFLRPTVLRDPQRAESLTGGRYDYILGEQKKAAPPHSPPLPDMEPPSLPPR